MHCLDLQLVEGLNGFGCLERRDFFEKIFGFPIAESKISTTFASQKRK